MGRTAAAAAEARVWGSRGRALTVGKRGLDGTWRPSCQATCWREVNLKERNKFACNIYFLMNRG